MHAEYAGTSWLWVAHNFSPKDNFFQPPPFTTLPLLFLRRTWRVWHLAFQPTPAFSLVYFEGCSTLSKLAMRWKQHSSRGFSPPSLSGSLYVHMYVIKTDCQSVRIYVVVAVTGVKPEKKGSSTTWHMARLKQNVTLLLSPRTTRCGFFTYVTAECW